MAKTQGTVQQVGIQPVRRGVWHAAWEKLQEAETAIRRMQDASDRIEYEGGWTQFVDSLEEFWTRFFDEGKQSFTRFQPWAGAFDAERRRDDLLRYLYQARHQSQHGRISLEWGEGRFVIA